MPDLGHGVEERDLVRVRWEGLLTPRFIEELFLAIWTAGFKTRRAQEQRSDLAQDDGGAHDGSTTNHDPTAWFSLSAHGVGEARAWSLMQFPSRETLVWDVRPFNRDLDLNLNRDLDFDSTSTLTSISTSTLDPNLELQLQLLTNRLATVPCLYSRNDMATTRQRHITTQRHSNETAT
ncbi:hypothetical protein OPT61_g7696 [Boeremia exigua]|uniref:Uncharacterized protein n=1 Tax=Boeremia exigua TaxID=749465 RepID=A0ACC2I1L0_9PLEO|nr:hypothetical protein OPT61_g7696 [Boeremia exigua]